jgi:hypothetical protein
MPPMPNLLTLPTDATVRLIFVNYVLTDDQQELLRRLGSAYSHRDEDGSKQPFILVAAMGGGPWLQHQGLRDGSSTADVGDLDELERKGLIAFLSRRNAYDGDLRLTAEGERHAETLERVRRGVPQGAAPMSMDWEESLPVLRAALGAWEKAGAPQEGVHPEEIASELGREPQDPHLGAALRQLEVAGYLSSGLAYQQVRYLVPAPRTHELLSGWPGQTPELLYQRLLEILDGRIADATTPEERTRLEMARDRFIDLGQTVAGGVLTALATGSL